jgi:Zn-dependent protease
MNFLNASFRIGRLFDIDIRVHILFIIWWAFRLFTSSNPQVEMWFGAMLFFIILVHEFGHCFGARSVGGSAHNILMWPLGGLAFASAPMRPWEQFVTVAAGPAVNVAFCLITGIILVAAAGNMNVITLNPLSFPTASLGGRFFFYMQLFYIVNLWLLAFNLLPIYPMDGGQLFQCLIWPFVGLRRATDVACKVGIVGSIGLIIWSLSDGGGGILMFIGVFGIFTCYQRLQALRMGLVQEDAGYAGYDFSRGYTSLERSSRRIQGGPGFWSRFTGMFKSKPKRRDPRTGQVNPNPGAWERKMEERDRLEREVDRILKKVHEQGVHSLTHVEKSLLEQATRKQREEERAYDRLD